MRAWCNVAYLAKTRNLDGGFVAKSAAGLPFLLSEGTAVAFVPPVLDMPRSGVVESVEMIDDTSALVYFDCIDNKNDATFLVGSHCLMRNSDIPRDSFADAPWSWEGWEVIDEKFGHLGEVAEVQDNPGQMLLVVERDGIGNDILIPVVDEFVIDVDVDECIIGTNIPAGLLDL